MNFVADSADFLQAKCDFTRKTVVWRLEPLFGGLGAKYDVHLRLVAKRLVYILLVLTGLFARSYG